MKLNVDPSFLRESGAQLVNVDGGLVHSPQSRGEWTRTDTIIAMLEPQRRVGAESSPEAHSFAFIDMALDVLDETGRPEAVDLGWHVFHLL